MTRNEQSFNENFYSSGSSIEKLFLPSPAWITETFIKWRLKKTEKNSTHKTIKNYNDPEILQESCTKSKGVLQIQGVKGLQGQKMNYFYEFCFLTQEAVFVKKNRDISVSVFRMV